MKYFKFFTITLRPGIMRTLFIFCSRPAVYFRIFILAFCLGGMFSACVKNTIPPVKPVAPDFDWKTSRAVSISVSAGTGVKSGRDTKKGTKVWVYASPLYTEESLVVTGYAYTGEPFETFFDLPTSRENVYVKTVSPQGILKYSYYRIAGTKAVKGYAAGLLTKAVGVSLPPLPEIPSRKESECITVTSESNFYEGKQVLPRDGYLVKNRLTVSEKDIFVQKGNNRSPEIYISGVLTVKNDSEIRNCKLIVLEGGKLIFEKNVNITGNGEVYIARGGALIMDDDGEIVLGNNAALINMGVLYGEDGDKDSEGADLKMQGNSRFYNAGTARIDELEFSSKNNEICGYRGSEMIIEEIATGGGGSFILESGSVTVLEELDDVKNLNFSNPLADGVSGGEDYAHIYWGLEELPGQDGQITGDRETVDLEELKQNVHIEGNIECVYPAGDLKTCESYTKLTCNGGKGEMLPAYWTPGAKHTSGGAIDDDEDISYSPSKGVWGSYAFEDLWPYVGDYDMNDAVLDYQVVYYHPAGSNGSLVRSMEFKWSLRAAGTGYKLSMGVQLDKITPSQVASIGNSHKNISASGPIGGYATGLEEGQRLAVFPLFNDPKEIFGRSTFINTETGQDALPVKEYSVKIDFTAPVNKENLTTDYINVFLVVSDINRPFRDKEIHLKGFKPTDKANPAYFNMGFAGGQNGDPYTATNNMVWGIQIPEKFIYPQERVAITEIYRNFENWYSSAGTAYQDWYKGDRDENALYPLLEKEK